MPKFNILPTDMTLYSTVEPKGRLFLAGDQWPGDAWSEKPGGDVAGAGTGKKALEDLMAAQDQIEQLQQLLESQGHDLAQTAKERDEANAKLAAAEQRAADAEKKAADAEAAAAEVTAQRDQLAGVETELRAKLAAADEATKETKAWGEAMNARVAELDAKLAAFDGDGDGAPGGSKKKA